MMKVKDLLLLGAAGLLAFSLMFGGRNYNQRVALSERVTELNIFNSQLFRDNIDKDSLINLSELREVRLDSAYKAKELEFKNLKKKQAKVNAENIRLIAELDKISSDSSYKYLQDSVYFSTIEPKPYGFDSVQVKSIHKDYINRVHLTAINGILEAKVVKLLETCGVCDSLLVEERVQTSLLTHQTVNWGKIYDNEKKKADLFKKLSQQNANKKTFWTITTAIASGIAVAALIL